MALTLFMAATAGAYGWYVHGWYGGLIAALALVTVIPKALWAVVQWRVDKMDDPTDPEALHKEIRMASRMSWLSWIGVLILIAITGGRFG